MAGPAYTRLDVDERRRRLLAIGAELFIHHSYDELSMAAVAREAGISKALLYHYFPSKQAFFEATLAETAAEILVRTSPDPSKPPLEQLSASLDAYLEWIEEHADAYHKLLESATGSPEVSGIIEGIRDQSAARVLDGLYPEGDPKPAVRSAVRGWLWFIDGACLDWTTHGGSSRDELHGLLLGTLLGALTAAGMGDDLSALLQSES
ncbi:MAG: TetR/AcrR family transcriptional regulator [Solirubrobacteraceae bacterium]